MNCYSIASIQDSFDWMKRTINLRSPTVVFTEECCVHVLGFLLLSPVLIQIVKV